jgi:hypothetical protein
MTEEEKANQSAQGNALTHVSGLRRWTERKTPNPVCLGETKKGSGRVDKKRAEQVFSHVMTCEKMKVEKGMAPFRGKRTV